MCCSSTDIFHSTWASSIILYYFDKNILRENEESDGIFGNISFVDMKSSKLY